MKTLAMMKMEKNFVAVIEKGYPRKPYNALDLDYLIHRLHQETLEFTEAMKKADIEGAKLELADISNIVDYLFEKLS